MFEERPVEGLEGIHNAWCAGQRSDIPLALARVGLNLIGLAVGNGAQVIRHLLPERSV
jgi:hypothetical protein